MQVSRSPGVGSRAGSFCALALAILGLGFLVFSPAPAAFRSTDEPAAGQAALRAVVDPETGTLTTSTLPVEKSTDFQLQSMLSRSTEGLREVVYPHGGVGVNLQGRFQSASVARIDAEGRLTTTCVESGVEAEAFLRGRGPEVSRPELEVQ